MGARKDVQIRGRQLLEIEPHERVQLILHRGTSMISEAESESLKCCFEYHPDVIVA